MSEANCAAPAGSLPEYTFWKREGNAPHSYRPAKDRPWQLWTVTDAGVIRLLATDFSRKVCRDKGAIRWAEICAENSKINEPSSDNTPMTGGRP